MENQRDWKISESRDKKLDIKIWQVYPLLKGLNYIQGLDSYLRYTYISGL